MKYLSGIALLTVLGACNEPSRNVVEQAASVLEVKVGRSMYVSHKKYPESAIFTLGRDNKGKYLSMASFFSDNRGKCISVTLKDYDLKGKTQRCAVWQADNCSELFSLTYTVSEAPSDIEWCLGIYRRLLPQVVNARAVSQQEQKLVP
jgi:spore maturation protein CgeB